MELIELGCVPINETSLAGEDVRSSDIYDKLVTEIDKRTNLSANTTVDWSKVISLSHEILSTHSKDILVCSYLSVGLIQLNGMHGLATSVKIYKDLIVSFWDHGLFPPRINGRINAINWWVENTSNIIQKLNFENFSPTEKEQFETDFEGLINAFDTHNVDVVSDLLVLRNLCLQHITVLDPASIETTTTSNNSTNDISNTSSQVSTPSASISNAQSFAPLISDNVSSDNIEKYLENTVSALTKISSIIANEQPLSYKVFKINRFSAWFEIETLPICDEESKTMLPPPDEYLQNSLRSLYTGSNWLELIKQAESFVSQYRFWLDLSFYSYTALKSMNMLPAANEISSAILLFIKRLPNVEKLLFSDGTPFASTETQDWINQLLNNDGSSNLSSVAYVGAANNPDYEIVNSELQQAKDLFSANDLNKAISLLHNSIVTSQNSKLRLLRMINFCQFCIFSENTPLIAVYVTEMIGVINKYDLESWDTALAVNVYSLILNITINKKLVVIDEKIIEDVLARLSLIDPLTALPFITKLA